MIMILSGRRPNLCTLFITLRVFSSSPVAAAVIAPTAHNRSKFSAQRRHATLEEDSSGRHGEQFESFVRSFGRDYRRDSPEYHHRRGLFSARMEAIERQNSRPNRLWTAAVNNFADFTEEERARLRGWKDLHRGRGHEAPQLFEPVSLIETGERQFPEEKNWMHLKSASNLLDQGACGSCWAVATVSALEAHYEIAHKKTRTFSIQELVSCTPNPRHCGGKGGCDGATVELGMYWALHGGLGTEEENSYLARDSICSKPAQMKLLQDEQGKKQEMDDDGRILLSMKEMEWKAFTTAPKAKAKSQMLKAQSTGKSFQGHRFGLIGYTTLEKNKEEPLINAINSMGPVAITVGASDWFEYSSGIFDSCKKDIVVDHAVTLFGYGSDKDNKYWLIRNSWGPSWGERGFLRMKRLDDEENNCGWDDKPQQGVACDGAPPKVKVCGSCGILYDSVVPHFGREPASLEEDAVGKITEDHIKLSVDGSVEQESETPHVLDAEVAEADRPPAGDVALGVDVLAQPVLMPPVTRIRREDGRDSRRRHAL